MLFLLYVKCKALYNQIFWGGFICAILPLLQAKWGRERGVGLGKFLESGFKLGMPEKQWRYVTRQTAQTEFCG